MPGSYEGVLRGAATRLGITETEYHAHLAAGEKRCTLGRHWVHWKEFGFDRTRGDGLSTSCSDCRNRRARELYVDHV